jgi:hypothetical protein
LRRGQTAEESLQVEKNKAMTNAEAEPDRLSRGSLIFFVPKNLFPPKKNVFNTPVVVIAFFTFLSFVIFICHFPFFFLLLYFSFLTFSSPFPKFARNNIGRNTLLPPRDAEGISNRGKGQLKPAKVLQSALQLFRRVNVLYIGEDDPTRGRKFEPL